MGSKMVTYGSGDSYGPMGIAYVAMLVSTFFVLSLLLVSVTNLNVALSFMQCLSQTGVWCEKVVCVEKGVCVYVYISLFMGPWIPILKIGKGHGTLHCLRTYYL